MENNEKIKYQKLVQDCYNDLISVYDEFPGIKGIAKSESVVKSWSKKFEEEGFDSILMWKICQKVVSKEFREKTEKNTDTSYTHQDAINQIKENIEKYLVN